MAEIVFDRMKFFNQGDTDVPIPGVNAVTGLIQIKLELLAELCGADKIEFDENDTRQTYRITKGSVVWRIIVENNCLSTYKED
jgi:hypothetical protein